VAVGEAGPGSDRLFVAVWPPAGAVEALAAIERPAWPDLRWTAPDQWHVTLRFLGRAVPAPDADAALAGVVHPPCLVTMGPAVRPLGRHLLVVEVTGLDSLAAAVGRATVDLVAQQGGRPWRGHLTIARARGRADLRRRGGQPLSASWRAEDFALVASQLHPQGARYRTLARYRLGNSGHERAPIG
jgi:2'-5' RNA ligase